MSEIDQDGTKAVIRPGKNIVAGVVEEFRAEIKDLLNQDVTDLTMDLTGVNILDSMGLSVMVATHNSLQKNGTKLQISGGADNIIKLLKDMRLDRHFAIEE